MATTTTRAKYPSVRCSFCGRSTEAVEKMITGPSVHICSHCVEMCNEILREDKNALHAAAQPGSFPTPQQMKDEVRRRIEDLAPGGGFVLTPRWAVRPDVSPENLCAIYEAVQEYGGY